MTALSQAKRIVIKLGTGVLTSGIGELDSARIDSLCQNVQMLRNRGIEVIIVSSGAVGLGMGKLGLQKRPKDLATLQACASIGQTILINTWQKSFDPQGLTVAQILLTREDLRAKHRHTAVFNTVEQLLSHSAVPIVNENDTVSAAEIKFGDNDTLSALVASVTNADLLFILSNVPGLIDMKGSGEVVERIEKITPEIEAMARGPGAETSVGGMVSKLSAAKIAQRAGCGVIVGSGKDDSLFQRLLRGEPAGTYFVPSSKPVKSHKRWIAIQDHSFGSIHIDQGAADALISNGKSLLAAGIASIEGDFQAGDVVKVIAPSGAAIAQGIINIDATCLNDYSEAAPVIHRDNLVLL
ncbi:MAG: glutamate 5-kinase [Opitutales bacterium]